MRLFQHRSLFWRTLSTIAVISIGFQLITLSLLAYYVLVPLGRRATDDLASVIVHAAERWEELSTDSRGRFSQELFTKHDLLVTKADRPLAKSTNLLPYLFFLEQSLTKHLGQEVVLKQSTDDSGNQWIWADIPKSKQTLRFGFQRDRIGVQPPVALFIMLIVGLYLTFITAVILTRRLTVPVERLYAAAGAIGKGRWPEPIQEEGPEELVMLTRTFNRMNLQVKELLANRTTLLAGIAHDLRTPLTQIQLALSMLPNNGGDSAMMDSIRNDLDEINRLISASLSLGLELADEKKVPTDVNLELENTVNAFRKNGAAVEWIRGESCCQVLQPLALRRILINLIENAVRYGAGMPITVTQKCADESVIVKIMDRGPGIPPEQKEAVFRPFYRLEMSRGSDTGGSGLGLAIVRQLADANGWNVELLPRSGGGTNAVLTIPCHT